MSLDVYLTSANPIKRTCDECGQECEKHETLYDANITHNLGTMAGKAGIYKHLWRPEEIEIKTAGELIEPLTRALCDMKDRPEYYKQFDAENGWGTYKDFVPWIESYLAACIEYPDATVRVWR